MSEAPDSATEARRIDALYRAKARAEADEAEALVPGEGVVRGQGDLLASVLLVKGEPGAGDRAKGRALAGDDGVAIGKALDALGLPSARYALCTRVGPDPEAVVSRVRLLTEAVDPRVVVLLDAEAAADFAAAYEVSVPKHGQVVRVLGREVLAVDGFEASLSDEKRKRRVWRQLQALKRGEQG